jgi:pimeloyl-ACP methyl ester carboxylesterase
MSVGETSGVTVAGRRLEVRYTPARASDTPVLVFLHEGLGSIGLWKDVPERLAEATRCATLVYSRYGNGFSQVLAEPRTVEYMHDEARTALPQLLEAYDVRDAVLIGHSDGASIALIYAGEIRAHVRGLVLEAPHVFVEDLSVESIARAKSFYETTDLRTRLACHHEDVDRTFYGWNDIWLDPRFRDWNIRASLHGIRAPMFLLQGVQDEYGTIAQLEAIREGARFARTDMMYLADCGHAPHRDRPELVLGAIAAFVNNLR